MNRWYWGALSFPLIFFITGARWLVWCTAKPKPDLVQSLCMLKADATRQQYLSFVQTCTNQECSYRDAIIAFLEQKKQSAVQKLCKEFDVSQQDVAKISQRWIQLKCAMRADPIAGIQLYFSCSRKAKKTSKRNASFQALQKTVEDICAENGAQNVCIEIVQDADVLYPTVYFQDIKSAQSDVPNFLLLLPEGFDEDALNFQRGNLEHELMHVACGHPIFMHDLSAFISERDRVDCHKLFMTESFAKLMRAFEYEADLLPALKHPKTAYNLLLALDSITTSDELHPPTRKRKKMVMRAMRLGQFASAAIT